jgi:hypothetical protein
MNEIVNDLLTVLKPVKTDHQVEYLFAQIMQFFFVLSKVITEFANITLSFITFERIK